MKKSLEVKILIIIALVILIPVGVFFATQSFQDFVGIDKEAYTFKEVYENVKDRVEVTPIGELPLKGKEVGVFIYQVDNVK